MRRFLPIALLALCLAHGVASAADFDADAARYSSEFSGQVDKRYQVALSQPAIDAFAADILARPEIAALAAPEFVVVVNRHPKAQQLAIFLVDARRAAFVGAARVSTGTTGRKEYFLTPLGLFENKRENGNYRALGTKNENGIRGLGSKGLRVFDFGWQASVAGWGKQGPAQIRLQMHGTDPDYLEQRLGTPASKGCVRVHHDVNRFIDENGVLDKDYDGSGAWALSKAKKSSPYDGRYMLVVEHAPEAP